MTSDQENVQTIRIQLENATDHKDKKSQSLRRRRIRRVIVESDFSSHDDADAETDATSDSSDQENEDEIITKAKKVYHQYIKLITDYSHSIMASSSRNFENSSR
jgi:hypothetical protein